VTEERNGMVNLDTVQQVLRGMTVSIAAAGRMDMAELATLLQGFATSPATLDPLARRMLLDLASGLDLLAVPRRQ
jgi:hypothetical protein